MFVNRSVGFCAIDAMRKSSIDLYAPSSSPRSEDIVEEILSENPINSSEQRYGVETNSGSCRTASMGSSKDKPMKLEEPEVQQQQSFRSYSTSDLLDLGTVVREYDDLSPYTHQMSPSKDVTIPEIRMDSLNEDLAAMPVLPGIRNSTHHSSQGNYSNSTNYMNRSLYLEKDGSVPLRETLQPETLRKETLPKVSENEALRGDPNQNVPIKAEAKPIEKPRTGRKFLRRRSSERTPFENVPDFIKNELLTTSGIGHFTMSELMCCLLFAHREALSSNSYANIRSKMGNKRSRVSIRRKIEKIVLSETGLSGGLLGLCGEQNRIVLEAIWSRLMSLISDAETYGTQNLKVFAAQLREYAQNPLKFARR